MSVSMMTLMIMGIIIFYAIAIILIVNFIGRKFFKDKTNMIFVYAGIILVCQMFVVIKDLISDQAIDPISIVLFCIGLGWIVQGIRKKRANNHNQ